jgi:hypothetical protein
VRGQLADVLLHPVRFPWTFGSIGAYLSFSSCSASFEPLEAFGFPVKTHAISAERKFRDETLRETTLSVQGFGKAAL